jgi:hypothetical protein
MRGSSLAGDARVHDDLGQRVAALSAEKLALLNLRLRQGGPADGGDGATTIPRRAREPAADLLSRLDELSDAEVTALLDEKVVEERQSPRGRDPASPAAIPRVPRQPAGDVVAAVERMSESEVDALLDELMPGAREESP